MNLYRDTTIQVRCDIQGNLTKPIPVYKGVRQGCILAPLLFNLYLNDLSAFISLEAHHSKLAAVSIPLLLYADDAVLLSFSKIGLRQILRAFGGYCEENCLTINYSKTKIMVFSKNQRRSKWTLNGHSLEQVKTFKYLGITFQSSRGWTSQRSAVIQSAKNSAMALVRFFYTRGGQFLPAAMKVFQAKVLPQLLFRIPIWILGFSGALEQVLSAYLRKLFGVSNCVPSAVLRLEAGCHSVECTAWTWALKYWLKLYAGPDSGFLQLVRKDNYTTLWSKSIQEKLLRVGFSSNFLITQDLLRVQQILTRRIKDIDLQYSLSSARTTCSPVSLGLV
ncbi:uncharacterized protein LOC121916078 [Sceloporus undulatus]|uniref:uncharacterized protein LOC121916078 n=1 Tax=Sceloporus undulatus TaxID=8520 RepID=UPI001C4AC5C6|nr:uncharacterized protein LOC121916078 [Sceloporus undulatus]XP_042296776.1 uncharacterized protein LOC121916078 [Sceloporus undulatus]XP_042296777.1 uncharacterized protein LOC121916078 [Sceloporus undulatus]XP_042296778.1 uncharacterized protein LOC121916078 [Sceloporus undulatus]